MNRLRIILLATILMLVLAASAFAGMEWEFSARHQALAGTGNAIFNMRGLSPSLENIACLVGSPNYNILFEGSTRTTNMVSSEDDIDYYYRAISGMMGLKTTYPTLQRDDDEEFGGRLAIGFVPGLYSQNYYRQETYADNKDELKSNMTHVQFFQRLGIAYGINEYVALGVGFALVPPTIISVTHDGEINGVDQQDDYTTYAPLLFSPEIGILTRPVEFVQLGLAFEVGDLKNRESEVTHTYADSEEDVTTDAIYGRSPSLGFGFAILIPDIEKFMVGFDFDVDWRRGLATDYGYFADNQKLEWSIGIEKMWEVSSIKGGLGYADEAGTTKYMPYDRFFVTFGSDLFFDEHIMMGIAFRGETGHLEEDPKGGLAFGGGFSWTFGGSF